MTSKIRFAALALVVAAPVLGCAAQVFYTPLLAPPHPMRAHAVQEVEVLVVTSPARPHTNVALLQVVQGTDTPGTREMIERLRAAAAERGCDAILITSVDNRASKSSAPSVEASCVVYSAAPTP